MQRDRFTIDTTRCLCSTPLSHIKEIDWNCDEIVTSDVNLRNYWEAFPIFRGFNLTQLDIVGNAIADENFKSFLVKIVPTLMWLHGGDCINLKFVFFFFPAFSFLSFRQGGIQYRNLLENRLL